MSFSTTERKLLGVTICSLEGRITLGEGSSEFRRVMNRYSKAEDENIVLDLGSVGYIDSAGVSELEKAHDTFLALGKTVVLVGLTKRIKDLLAITRLYRIFGVFDSPEDAVAAIHMR